MAALRPICAAFLPTSKSEDGIPLGQQLASAGCVLVRYVEVCIV